MTIHSKNSKTGFGVPVKHSDGRAINSTWEAAEAAAALIVGVAKMFDILRELKQFLQYIKAMKFS